MSILFYIAAIVALTATAMVITRKNAVHALLYLVVSFLAIAMIFYMLGAPFIAALEVIIYAGAIMVLFIFVMMMLNIGDKAVAQEREWLKPGGFIGPIILALILTVCFAYMMMGDTFELAGTSSIGPVEIGVSLFSKYLLGVELAGFLLLAALIGAFHLGQRIHPDQKIAPGESSRPAEATREEMKA